MEHGYRLYGARWLMVALAFYINFAVMAVEQPLTPNASIASRYLGVSVSAIHWLKYAWSLAAVAGALPGLFLVEKIGLKKFSFLSAVLLVVGCGLRCGELNVATLAERSGQKDSSAFVLILVGSIVAAIAVIPLQAMTTLIAASWFDDGQRGLANTLVRSIAVQLTSSAS